MKRYSLIRAKNYIKSIQQIVSPQSLMIIDFNSFNTSAEGQSNSLPLYFYECQSYIHVIYKIQILISEYKDLQQTLPSYGKLCEKYRLAHYQIPYFHYQVRSPIISTYRETNKLSMYLILYATAGYLTFR